MYSDLLLLAPALLVYVVLLLLKTRSPQETPINADPPDHDTGHDDVRVHVHDDGPPLNAIVVDGSNVMHWGGEPSAIVLRAVLWSLESHGYAPIVFFDASAGYRLGDTYFNELALAKVTGIRQEHICVVDKGVVADEMILSFARDHGLRIVTNDQFRDWRVKFPIAAKKGQLVKGTIRDGTVIWRGSL